MAGLWRRERQAGQARLAKGLAGLHCHFAGARPSTRHDQGRVIRRKLTRADQGGMSRHRGLRFCATPLARPIKLPDSS